MDKYLSIIKDKADYGELFIYNNESQKIAFESGTVKSYDTKSKLGYAVRVTKDDKTGFSYGNDFEKIGEVVDNALSTIKYTNEKAIPFAEQCTIPETPKEIYNKDIEKVTPEEMIEANKILCQKVSEIDPKLLPDSDVSRSITEISLATTNGFNGNIKTSAYSAGVGVTLIKPEDIFQWGGGAAYLNSKIDYDQIAKELAEDVELINNKQDSISGKLPVIFSPLMMSQLYCVFEEGISGSNIYRKTSPLVDKINSKIFDDRISIFEDPKGCDYLGFSSFDHEGTIVKRKPLVENGVLKNYMLTRKFAEKLKMSPTGNGYRNKFLVNETSIDTQPAACRNTTVIEGGNSSLEEMLSGIKDGIYCVYSPNIFQGNIVSGDFSGSLYLSYRIKNGKLLGRMKNLTVSGNIYDLFTKQLVSLSKETKAHSWVPTFKSPHVLLKDVTISG